MFKLEKIFIYSRQYINIRLYIKAMKEKKLLNYNAKKVTICNHFLNL